MLHKSYSESSRILSIILIFTSSKYIYYKVYFTPPFNVELVFYYLELVATRFNNASI